MSSAGWNRDPRPEHKPGGPNGPPSKRAGKTPVRQRLYDSRFVLASRNGKDVRLTQGSRVRPDDKLFAIINASQPVFVYIINRDETGQSFLLFPLPGVSPGNPIPTSQMTRLPGTENGRQINWNVTSAGGQEHFFLYVTPERLVSSSGVNALPRAEWHATSQMALSPPRRRLLAGRPESSASSRRRRLEPTGSSTAVDQKESAAVFGSTSQFQNPAKYPS